MNGIRCSLRVAGQTAVIAGLALACAAGRAAAADGAVNWGALRLLAARPDAFDYVLTSVVQSASNAVVLAFNHRSGRTEFVRVGGRLGDCEVRSFQPARERVFNPTINAHQEREGGRAVLAGADGRETVLEMGRLTPRDGLRAVLASLESGEVWSGRAGEALAIGGAAASIVSVATNRAVVAAAGAERTVAAATDAERAALDALWAKQRSEYEEARRLAAASRAAARDEAEAKAAPKDDWQNLPPAPRRGRTIEIQSPPRMFFGTDYPWPTEYDVLPPLFVGGKMIHPAVVVPRRFEWRSSGIRMEAR